MWLGISQQNICASVSKTGLAWDRRLHLLGFYPSFVKVSFTLSDSPSQYRVPQPSALHTVVLSPIEALYKSVITPEESPLSFCKYPTPWRPQKINGAIQQDVFGIWPFSLRKVCLRFSHADMSVGSSSRSLSLSYVSSLLTALEREVAFNYSATQQFTLSYLRNI